MQVYKSLYNCRAKFALQTTLALSNSFRGYVGASRANNNNLGGFPPSGRNINTQNCIKLNLMHIVSRLKYTTHYSTKNLTLIEISCSFDNFD